MLSSMFNCITVISVCPIKPLTSCLVWALLAPRRLHELLLQQSLCGFDELCTEFFTAPVVSTVPWVDFIFFIFYFLCQLQLQHMLWNKFTFGKDIWQLGRVHCRVFGQKTAVESHFMLLIYYLLFFFSKIVMTNKDSFITEDFLLFLFKFQSK